jgi:hypothetical protein
MIDQAALPASRVIWPNEGDHVDIESELSCSLI